MSRERVSQFEEWLKENRVGGGECLVADMAGIAREKILPTGKFLNGIRSGTLRLPESIFGQMVTGADSDTDILTYQAPDMTLTPDLDTLRIVPWYQEPTAQVICDCARHSGEVVPYAPRAILRK